MGRPYESELSELAHTYAWSISESAQPLATSLAAAARLPLIAVGSGGSLTSAAVAALLHTRFTGQLARVMTPYELATSPLALKEVAVVLCTAGGSNPDILSCFDSLVRREPALLTAICTRRNTLLGKAAASHNWAFCHEFASPVRKDGFLATNSLLATATMLVRAYQQLFSVPTSLPSILDDLLNPNGSQVSSIAQLEAASHRLIDRCTLVVLHGSMTQPAAADIESRFTEAALGNVQLADYRNFAHGRHHWLARKADQTAVLILSTPEDEQAAEKTASLIPKSIPVLRLRFAPGFAGVLSSVLHSIYLGWFLARQHGIDPGRPRVASFGRRLYHLRSIPKSPPSAVAISAIETSAIERKSGLTVAALHARNELEEWRGHYRAFQRKMTKTAFHGVIFDYDGTLCGSTERYSGLRKEVVSALVGLLQAGILVGIATGRGKSVKEALRAQIRRRSLQAQALIGYHNAGEIGSLDNDSVPPINPPLHPSLASVNTAIAGNAFLSRNASAEAKGTQITLEASSPLVAESLWEVVSDIVRHHADPGVRIVQSTHSVDILAPGVSKRSLLSAMTERLRGNHPDPTVLCLGDRGQWPGNDFELLQHEFALSVDQTSQDPCTCWNVAPPGVRYVDACLYYLRHLVIGQGVIRVSALAEKIP